MKFRTTIMFLVVLLMGISSGCKKKEIENLRQEKEELSQKIEEKDSTIKELTKLYDQVEKKIKLIVEQKGDVSLDLKDVSHDRARKNLMSLNEAIQTNKKKIRSLSNEQNGLRYQANKYKKEVNQLQADMKVQKDSIEALNTELKDKTSRIKNMLAKLEKQDSTISTRNAEIKALKDSLNKKEKTINTAYIAVMPEDKLKEKGIIMKTGGFLGFLGQTYVIDPTFNQSDFNSFNIAEQTTIPINSREKDIEFVTRHPDDAYTLIAGDQGNTVLKITDPDKFWRTGKRLVILY